MTADELRALAETLEHECALRLIAGGKNHEEAQACEQAADYLRACADAVPVAWVLRSKTRRNTDGDLFIRGCYGTPRTKQDYEFAELDGDEYIELVPRPAPAAPQAEPIDPHMIAAEGRFPDAPQAEPMTWLSTDDAETQLALAIQDAAKRAPTSDDKALLAALNGRGIWLAWIGDAEGAQAEPCVGNDRACPCQDGDACHYKDADGTKAWPVYNPFLRECTEAEEQAEPKRPQTCLWSRSDDDTDVWETACGNAFTINEGGAPADNEMTFCCFCGRELKGEIGDSDADN